MRCQQAEDFVGSSVTVNRMSLVIIFYMPHLAHLVHEPNVADEVLCLWVCCDLCEELRVAEQLADTIAWVTRLGL